MAKPDLKEVVFREGDGLIGKIVGTSDFLSIEDSSLPVLNQDTFANFLPEARRAQTLEIARDTFGEPLGRLYIEEEIGNTNPLLSLIVEGPAF